MKKQLIRVTKWLGDIPVQAECTACAATHFQAKSASPRPNREEYQRSLQGQFDAHFKNVHMSEDSNQTAARMPKAAADNSAEQ